MTEDQLIEELLLEAGGLGLREDVLDASEKYIEQGMDRLEALETAFNELTSDFDEEDEDDDPYLYDLDSEDDEDWEDEDGEYWENLDDEE